MAPAANLPGRAAPQDKPAKEQNKMSAVEQPPTFAAERTPSEWEAAFLAEQASVMGGSEQESFNKEASFQAERTPSEWERAVLAEQASVKVEPSLSQTKTAPGAPARADSFANLSPEELEKQFMAQMAEAMGSSTSAPAPARAESFSTLSPEELERQFMAQMAAAMGSSTAVPGIQMTSSTGSAGSARSMGASPRSVGRQSSTGSASSKVLKLC